MGLAMDVASWTNNMIAALIQIRGEAARDPVGHRLPMITPLDTIAVLGRFSPMLATAIGGLQDHHGAPRGAIDVAHVDGDGLLIGGLAAASAVANRISITDYLSGYGVPGRAYERKKAPTASTRYTFYVGEFLPNVAETFLVVAHRQAVAEWQRGIDASVAALRNSPTDITRTIQPADNAAFWTAIRQLASSLDAIHANPPEDVFSRIKGATSDALDKTGHFVGEAAATISNKVGEIAGQAAEGFFSKAGLTSMVVAGLAVYMVVS